MNSDTITLEPGDLDIEQFTLGEIVEIEDRLGVTITNAESLRKVSQLKLAQALIFTVLRRTRPDVTWEEAGDIKLDQLGELNAAMRSDEDPR